MKTIICLDCWEEGISVELPTMMHFIRHIAHIEGLTGDVHYRNHWVNPPSFEWVN